MERKEFIKNSLATLGGMLFMNSINNLETLNAFTKALPNQENLMPILFIGHGNPMNAIEDNEFSRGWRKIAKTLPTPKAILCISAHWETKGTQVTAIERPKTIHDFGGFPKELFQVQYPAPGSSWLAKEVKKDIKSIEVILDEEWGFDHGSWSILKHLYPKAEVPLVQLSLDYTKDASYHYNLGRELMKLRKKGVLIIGSGNMVHNFQYAAWRKGFTEHFGHDWALEANDSFKKLILDKNHKSLIDYQKHSKAFELSAPTPEHYLPLLYILSLQNKDEKIEFFNDAVVAGSFSMTSVKIG